MYIYQAIYRPKDNPGKKQKMYWEFSSERKTEEQIIAGLKRRIHDKGLWRIYRSVNMRDITKAKIEMINVLVNSLVYQNGKPVEAIWLSCLGKNKLERFFLVDIDTKNSSVIDRIRSTLEIREIDIFLEKETINGYHWITSPFDSRLIHEENVDVQSDGMLLLDWFEVT